MGVERQRLDPELSGQVCAVRPKRAAAYVVPEHGGPRHLGHRQTSGIPQHPKRLQQPQPFGRKSRRGRPGEHFILQQQQGAERSRALRLHQVHHFLQDGGDTFVLGHHFEHAVAIFLQALQPVALGLDSVLQHHTPDAARHQFDQFTVGVRKDSRRAAERLRKAERRKQFRAQPDRRSDVRFEFGPRTAAPQARLGSRHGSQPAGHGIGTRLPQRNHGAAFRPSAPRAVRSLTPAPLKPST